MRKRKHAWKQVTAYVLSLAMVFGMGSIADSKKSQAAQYQFGSGQVALSQGDYQVPVAMKKADDTTAASMAAKALAQNAVLEVKEDGQADLTIEWQTLTVFGQSADATDIEAYIGDTASGATASAIVVSEREGVNGQKVPEKVKITLPDNSKDGIYIGMTAMGAHMTAYISIDYSKKVVGAALGSNVTFFAPGQYQVATSLKNASNIANASMAKDSLCDSGILSVMEDGTAVLQVEWKTLDMFGLKGNASDIKVYQGSSAKGNTVDAVVDSTREAQATVGSNVTTVEAPEKVSFTLPVHSLNGAYISMLVDAMNTTVDAFVQADYSTAKKIEASAAPEESASAAPEESTSPEATATAKPEESTSPEATATTKPEASASPEATATTEPEASTSPEATASTAPKESALPEVSASAAPIESQKPGAAATPGQTPQQTAPAENTNIRVTLNKTNVTLYTVAAKTEQLKAVVAGSNEKVKWTSSNAKVATVSANGLVTAKKAGKTVVTAAVGTQKASCVVQVKKPSLQVKKTKLTLKKGKKAALNVKAYPQTKIKYKSSKAKVATVSDKGVVKAKKKGNAVITISSNGIKKKVKIIVK